MRQNNYCLLCHFFSLELTIASIFSLAQFYFKVSITDLSASSLPNWKACIRLWSNSSIFFSRVILPRALCINQASPEKEKQQGKERKRQVCFKDCGGWQILNLQGRLETQARGDVVVLSLKSTGQPSRLETQAGFLCRHLDAKFLLPLETSAFAHKAFN